MPRKKAEPAPSTNGQEKPEISFDPYIPLAKPVLMAFEDEASADRFLKCCSDEGTLHKVNGKTKALEVTVFRWPED